jgi:hypothetical protein
MINEVRNTVLSILAKDNRGYITPFEFNLYAKQAQLEVFERYIYLYSNAIIKQNARMHGEGYADVPKKLSEVLDTFYKVDTLTYTSPYFEAPSDSYFIQKLVISKSSKEIEKVSHSKVLYLLASNLTAPSIAYPVYTLMDNDGTTTSRSNFMVYPDTITNVDAHYLRYPKEPKWTYTSVGGDPLFNQSANDYQDFEMPMSDFSDLVVKILQYAGVSIREQEVIAAAKTEELQEIQQKQ